MKNEVIEEYQIKKIYHTEGTGRTFPSVCAIEIELYKDGVLVFRQMHKPIAGRFANPTKISQFIDDLNDLISAKKEVVATKADKTIQINLQSLCNEIKIEGTDNETVANALSKAVEEKLLDILKSSNLDLK